MNEKDSIGKSIENITPGDGAKERMYANIMKKVSQNTENAEKQRNKTRSMLLRTVLPLAACICIAVIGAFRFVPDLWTDGSAPETDPAVLGGNPYVTADDSSAFEALGIALDAPTGAENKSYAVIGGEIAEVEFDLDGHSYTLRATGDGDPSGINGEIISRVPLDGGAELVTISVDGKGECKMVTAVSGGINVSLFNADDASEEEVCGVFAKIIFEEIK